MGSFLWKIWKRCNSHFMCWKCFNLFSSINPSVLGGELVIFVSFQMPSPNFQMWRVCWFFWEIWRDGNFSEDHQKFRLFPRVTWWWFKFVIIFIKPLLGILANGLHIQSNCLVVETELKNQYLGYSPSKNLVAILLIRSNICLSEEILCFVLHKWLKDSQCWSYGNF